MGVCVKLFKKLEKIVKKLGESNRDMFLGLKVFKIVNIVVIDNFNERKISKVSFWF